MGNLLGQQKFLRSVEAPNNGKSVSMLTIPANSQNFSVADMVRVCVSHSLSTEVISRPHRVDHISLYPSPALDFCVG